MVEAEEPVALEGPAGRSSRRLAEEDPGAVHDP